MYTLKPGIKQDAVRRWSLPDRIFYGHGACHILAGVFLGRFHKTGWSAVWVKPWKGFRGSHVFATNGKIAFDYHGYSVQDRLLKHHKKAYASRYAGWKTDIIRVDFSLLDTNELNSRNMRGPDQYFGDAIERTSRYLDRIDHERQKEKAIALL